MHSWMKLEEEGVVFGSCHGQKTYNYIGLSKIWFYTGKAMGLLFTKTHYENLINHLKKDKMAATNEPRDNCFVNRLVCQCEK